MSTAVKLVTSKLTSLIFALSEVSAHVHICQRTGFYDIVCEIIPHISAFYALFVHCGSSGLVLSFGTQPTSGRWINRGRPIVNPNVHQPAEEKYLVSHTHGQR